MKIKKITYDFSPEKNLKLKEEREISFEEIILAIEEEYLADVINHHNTGKYKEQKIYVVEIEGYIYLAPYIFY
ncbi:MAG: toxin [Proteobacteria bacterium]|nr:toxin [Pseudomonadota bacterium]